jgi:hypothetical protein
MNRVSRSWFTRGSFSVLSVASPWWLAGGQCRLEKKLQCDDAVQTLNVRIEVGLGGDKLSRTHCLRLRFRSGWRPRDRAAVAAGLPVRRSGRRRAAAGTWSCRPAQDPVVQDLLVALRLAGQQEYFKICAGSQGLAVSAVRSARRRVSVGVERSPTRAR